MEQRHGVCNLCEAICGLLLTVEDGRVVGARGNPDDPLSRGHICPKGTALADIQQDPDRLRRPVRRTTGPDGRPRWEEIDWPEAISFAVDGLSAVQQRHGRDAVAAYLGNPNVHSLGAMTHGSQVVKALGTRNVFSATSVDQLPHQLVAWAMFGHQLMLPIPDIDRTDLFVVFGANPMASNGSLMTVPDFPGRLRELRARGGRMIVLDPRRTETAQAADEHHFVRPGSDAAVLLALLHTVLAEDLAVEVPEFVDGVEVVRAAVEPFTPEYAAEVSGVPADTIRDLARALATTERAAAYGRLGVSTQAAGTVSVWAINVLNLLTGNLDRPGGVMFTRPAVDIVGRGIIGRGGHGRWRSRVRDLPETAGELPSSALAEEMTTPGEGQVRGLLTVAGNPVLSTPAGHRLDEALEDLEFMVSVDHYLNETTRHADVVLPPTSALERDHYDLAFHALAVRNTTRFTPAVLDKPAGARHDWEIFRDLALGLAARSDRKVPLKRRLVTAARLRLSPTRLVDLLLRSGHARLSVRKLRSRPDGVDLGPLEPCLPERLQTRDGRLHLAPDLVVQDLGRVRDHLDALPRDGLVLIGRRHRRDCNSWLHNTERLTKGKPRHHLLMHPADLAARGLTDGAPVRVVSRVGEVVVDVRSTEDVMPGVVSLPHGYGHASSPGTRLAREVPGVSINDLTDPRALDVSGNAAFSGVPVEVTQG